MVWSPLDYAFPFVQSAVELDHCMLIKYNVTGNKNHLLIGCFVINSRYSVYSIVLTYLNILCGRYYLPLVLEKKGQRWHYHYGLVASSLCLSSHRSTYSLSYLC